MPGPLSNSIVIVSIIFTAVAIVGVGLRLYCRKLKKIEYGIDDWLILPALFFTICHAATVCVGVFVGRLGEHVLINSDGSPTFDWTTEVFAKVSFISQILSLLCFFFTKLSILFFYRRIFIGATFSLITWTLIGICIIWAISFLIAKMVQCIPFELIWTTTYYTPNRNCYDVFKVYLAVAGSDFLLDLAILCLPWPNVWRLRLPTRQKFATAGIFMLGALVCGIGIARFVFFIQAVELGRAQSIDVTYYAAPPIYWTQLETNFAVICACLPTLRPLFQNSPAKSISGTQGGGAWNFKPSKTTIGRNKSARENDSSVALHSYTSSPHNAEDSVEPVPDGFTRVKQDLDLSFSQLQDNQTSTNNV